MTARHPRPSGLTLVEVLCALTLTGLILTTLTGLSRQVLVTEQVVQARQVEDLRTTAVLGAIERDLSQLVVDASSKTLEVAPKPGMTLRMVTLGRMRGSDATMSSRHPAAVTYRLVPIDNEDDETRVDLVRVQEDLTRRKGKRRPEERVIGRKLAALRVRVHDGRTWVTEWPPEQAENRVPAAVELQLEWHGRPGVTSRCVLLSPYTHD